MRLPGCTPGDPQAHRALPDDTRHMDIIFSLVIYSQPSHRHVRDPRVPYASAQSLLVLAEIRCMVPEAAGTPPLQGPVADVYLSACLIFARAEIPGLANLLAVEHELHGRELLSPLALRLAVLRFAFTRT